MAGFGGRIGVLGFLNEEDCQHDTGRGADDLRDDPPEKGDPRAADLVLLFFFGAGAPGEAGDDSLVSGTTGGGAAPGGAGSSSISFGRRHYRIPVELTSHAA